MKAVSTFKKKILNTIKNDFYSLSTSEKIYQTILISGLTVWALWLLGCYLGIFQLPIYNNDIPMIML